MSSTIVLNQANIAGVNNNTMVYRFPNSVAFPNHEIAVQSITMYYSWENINDTTLQNNKFEFTFYSGSSVGTTLMVVIPSGLYEITDINNYLQYFCIANGLYLINAAGQNVYFAEFLVNNQQYAIQINTYAFPTENNADSVPQWIYNAMTDRWDGVVGLEYEGWTTPKVGAGWSLNSGLFIGFNNVIWNPVITILANFNLIVGFPVGFFTEPNLGIGTTLSYLSPIAPQVQPNSSIFFSISNINNKYAIPSSIIYSLSPAVAFGTQISDRPPQYTWNKLLPGTYNELRVQILGLDKSPLIILDPNMTILLAIRDTKDNPLQDIMTTLTGGKS